MDGIFGLNEKGDIFNQFIGKYVVIYQPQGRIFSGKMASYDLESGYAVLNPHQSGDYDSEKGLTRKLSDKNSIVFMPGATIEPTTRKNLQASCDYGNSNNDNNQEKEAKAKSKKISKKTSKKPARD